MTDDEFQPEEFEQVHDMEAMAAMAFEGPAAFANRFHISSHFGVVRIAFADQHNIDTTPKHRAAVALQIADAADLVKILGRFLGLTVIDEADVDVAE